jgi:hypothetical protein
MNQDILLERRKAARRRVLKGAQIRFRDVSATIDCTVRDYSAKGATLVVSSPVGIPDRFNLVCKGASQHACQVVWRKPTQIGVQFMDATSA